MWEISNIIAFVGKKGAGKTTILEKVVAELKSRSVRVAVIKHDLHDEAEYDHPGRDSFRFARAGADIVVISSRTRLALFDYHGFQHMLAQIYAKYLYDVDVVLAEGFKAVKELPKIEVATEQGLLLTPEDNLVAVVSEFIPEIAVKHFYPQQIKEISDFVLELAKRQEGLDVSLIVDGEDIPMKEFVQKVIANGVLGMVSSLKAVSEPKDVLLRIKRI